MKNELDDFLEGIKGEEEVFEAPIAEPTEGEVKEEEEKDEKPLPFHKDPKVQKYVEKEIAKALETAKPSEAERFARETVEEDEMADVLVRIIGNDTPEKLQAIKDFRKELGKLEEKGAKRALSEFEQRQNEALKADKEAENELKQGFEDIEEQFEVDLNSPKSKKMKEEFVEYIKKIAPKKDGEIVAFPDIPAAFEEFQTRQKPQASNSRAKALASRSLGRSSEAPAETVPKDNSWASVDRLFSKLRK